MDRVHVLIEKLLTQKAANETPAQLQVTVQLLHEELRRLQQESYVGTSKKVAVVLPAVVRAITAEKDIEVLQNEVVEKPVIVSPPVVPVIEPKEERPMFRQPSFFDEPEAMPVIIEEPVQSVNPQSESVKEPYVLKKPFVAPHEPVKEEHTEPAQYHTLLPFDVLEETPTLSQQQTLREVHEVIGGKEASLNDRLKQEKADLVNVLKDTPIKDLRKGIGVNDKFLFINELFRGDEGLYERSIKTINAFHILPEAEYWINRELKIKLGWNEDKEVVRYFYQLVKRRFS